ncbi:MAG: HNH endonuclease [Sedimentisphaerales bacterium]
MTKLYLPIPIPTIIESIIIYFLLRYRKKRHGYQFRLIKLIQSNPKAKPVYAKVDPQDYQKLIQHTWLLVHGGNNIYYAGYLKDRLIVYMHREIMNAPRGIIVDHKNGDGLDNTKANLRLATPAQNASNRRRKKNSSSIYKGVTHRKNNYYEAVISCNGTYKYLGRFKCQEDAAKAYDKAAKELFGEYAALNFSHQDTKTLSLI